MKELLKECGPRMLNVNVLNIPGDARHIKELLERNYTVIFSNIDPVYYDHGEGSWLGTRHDYPYKNWQKSYNYDIEKLVGNVMGGDSSAAKKFMGQVLGGIAALWTEKV